MRRKSKGKNIGFTPVNQVVKGVLKSLENPQKQQEAYLFDLWNKLVDEKVRKHASPKKLFGKKLYVRVDDPVWAHELILRYKNEILTAFQKEVGKENIVDIQFQVGR